MSERLNRRQFFSLNWEATIGFLGNVIVPQLEGERDFFRPPGARDDLEFITSCTRCGICKEACPEGTISLFPLTSGAKLANTPFIDPNFIACTFCEKCIQACPSEALSMEGLLSMPTIGTAMIKQESCIAFEKVMCDYCVRACPIGGALLLKEGKPIVNKVLCNGCGLCVAGCISEEKGINICLS